MNPISVEGKTVLITGASRGIGKAMAEAFVDAGAIVYGTGSKQDSVAWMSGSKINGRVADVSKAGTMNPIIDEIKNKHQKLDCLINNAGIAVNTPAVAFKEDEIYKIIDTNFVGLFRACQYYYKTHKTIGGNIINISSVLGIMGYPLASIYAGTKGAAIQLTRALASEWTRAGFRLNAILPGFIDTDMNKMIKDRPEAHAASVARIPMKRLGKPEDLAGAAIFLASDASSYMTAQTIIIDGGISTLY